MAIIRGITFPNLKPTTTPISIRIPKYLLNMVKEKTNELTMPYQNLIRQYIQKGVLTKYEIPPIKTRRSK